MTMRWGGGVSYQSSSGRSCSGMKRGWLPHGRGKVKEDKTQECVGKRFASKPELK